MRINIDDDFDNELKSEYKSIDNDSVVGNGALSNNNTPIIEVEAKDVKEDYKYTGNESEKTDAQYTIKLQGATFIDESELKKYKEPTNIKKEEKSKVKVEIEENIQVKNKNKEPYSYIKNKIIKGKIVVTSKLGNKNGKNISEAKVNLYALNGLSPKLVSSKYTDSNGVAVFDNLPQGSYRVIEIVNRKYFEKPTYIHWNEVTIDDDLKEEKITIVNKIKRSSR